MSNTNSDSQKLFLQIIQRCKQERRNRTKLTIREVAKRIGKSENYVGSFEAGRTTPSLKTFLNYLQVIGFDTLPLTQLQVKTDTEDKGPEKQRLELLEKIHGYTNEQVGQLVEQSKAIDANVKVQKK